MCMQRLELVRTEILVLVWQPVLPPDRMPRSEIPLM